MQQEDRADEVLVVEGCGRCELKFKCGCFLVEMQERLMIDVIYD